MSNDSRSKQFLRVLHAPDGHRESMVQKVWRQLQSADLATDTYVCASRAQRDIIEHQIGNVPFIEEPERRDTFPAIALAALSLKDVHRVALDEPIAVVPIDHAVEDEYFHTIAHLEQVLAESQAELALMGVVPTAPNSQFGYMTVTESSSNYAWKRVRSFVEKPPVDEAQQLIQEGALWNCGVFSFHLRSLLQNLEAQGLPTTYSEFLEAFPHLVKQSFDYAVVEHAQSVAVLPFHGKWKDIGTWESLVKEWDEPMLGRGGLIDCEDTQVVNEFGVPLVAMGLKHAIVVTTPDGMLVADKSMAGRVKEVANEWNDRPMVEERFWGHYKVMDYQKLDGGTEVLTKWVEVEVGHHLKYQKHKSRVEIWTIVDGAGEVVIDGQVRIVRPGDVVTIAENAWHTIRAILRLRFVEVQRGHAVSDEDVERSVLSWDEILLRPAHL